MDERWQRPRGTQDVLPAEAERMERLRRLVAQVAELYGYGAIETPVFEQTAVFVDGVGGATDIVQHERYSFVDAGGVALTLRPEGTAAIARAYVENGLSAWPKPVRLYYWAPMFRRERPQKGRYRQHQQYGFELYGSSEPAADAEVLLVARRLLQAVGLSPHVLVNSIGCDQCRPRYREALVAYLDSHGAALCGDCRRRLADNPLRVLDCKQDQAVARGAPDIAAFWCDACRSHQEAVVALAAEAGIPVERDPALVRGIDYYSRTVFEVHDPSLGAQSTVLGGGRYDGLTARVGGAPVPAVGFAGGAERLLMAAGAALGAPRVPSAYVAQVGVGHQGWQAAERLRGAGIPTEVDLMARSLKAQMKEAGRRASVVVLAGGREWEDGLVTVKRLSDGREAAVALANLAGTVREWLNGVEAEHAEPK